MLFRRKSTNITSKYFLCKVVRLSIVLKLLIHEVLIKRNKVVLCYLTPSKVTYALEKSIYIRSKMQFSLLHLHCDISGMKNSNGVSLVQVSYFEDLYKIINELSDLSVNSPHILLDYLSGRLVTIKEDLRLYLKQQIALDIYDDLLLVNVTHWLATQKESPLYGKKPTLLFEKKSYWSHLSFDYMKKKGINFKIFYSMNPKRSKVIRFAYYSLKLLSELLISIVRGKIRPGVFAPKVGVPFYVFQNFTEYYDLKNYYLFWFPNSGIPPENVFIYLDEPKFALSAEEVKRIRNAGFGLVFCPRKIFAKGEYGVPVHICSFKTTLSLTVRYLKLIAQMYRCVKDRRTKELWKILSLLLVQLPYWEDFFQSNNIKVEFRFHDMFGIRDIAAKLTGAITISYHYSNHSHTSILHQEICDVFFIWGERYKNFLLPMYSTTKNVIQTGYVFDYTFKALKSKAINIEKNLKSASVSYIIGIFDENLKGNPGKAIIECYNAILTYAVENKNVGILIKPKKRTFIEDLNALSNLNELVEILKKGKRLLILDHEKYPAEAGYASSIVVGLVANSTAALECILAGIPTIVYDCSVSKYWCPYYEWGYNRVIFDNTDYLIRAIAESANERLRIDCFSDWASVLNSFDSFRDGKANRRVAEYIRTILFELSKGTVKEDSIKAANRAYTEKYGSDKVAEF